MAGTDDDNTISADDWRLAGSELAFVTEVVGSEKLADELLLDGLEDGSIRRRYRELAVDESPDFSVNPPLVTSLAAAHQFFWRRATHSRINVDWPSHRAIRVGPVIRLGSDGKGNNWPIFDMGGSATLKASLIRFHHGDVVAYLVALGLMKWPASEPFSPEAPATSSPSSQAPAISTALAENSEWPSAQALGIEADWQQRAILAVLPELYSKHPTSFDGKMYRHGGKRLAAAVGKLWVAKAEVEGEPPPHAPSEDTARRFLKTYRAWDANRRT